MARTLSPNAVLKELNKVGYYKDAAGGGTTTLTANVADGATLLPVAAITNFAVGDRIRIATGASQETNVVKTVGASDLTMKYPITEDHLSGEAVVELSEEDLGAVTDEGVTLEQTQEETEVRAGNRVSVYLFVPGHITRGFRFSVRDFDLENLQEAFGLPSTSLITTETPPALVIDPEKVATQAAKSWFFTSTREDGKVARVDVFAGKVFASNVSLTVTRGGQVAVPVNLREIMGVRIELG